MSYHTVLDMKNTNFMGSKTKLAMLVRVCITDSRFSQG